MPIRVPAKKLKLFFFREMNAHENFVFASVKGDYGEAVCPFFQYAVLISVPKRYLATRFCLKTVLFRNSAQNAVRRRFIWAGGTVFDFVKSRSEDTVEEWVQGLSCPVIRIDGRKPVEENINLILKQINFHTLRCVVKKIIEKYWKKVNRR